MKKRILTLGITLSLLVALVIPAVALATNQAGQEAATFSGDILIEDKVAGEVAVTTITFPPSAPGSTVSAPYNDVDGDTDPQVLDAAASEPVVTLRNSSVGALTVWLRITNWTDGVVVAEDYELVTEATVTVEVVDEVLSADGQGNLVETAISIPAGEVRALYLEVVLGGPGKSGTSTLSILGES